MCECKCVIVSIMYTCTHTLYSDVSKMVSNYKAMYGVALRASQLDSRTVSEQIECAQNCLTTVAAVRRDITTNS